MGRVLRKAFRILGLGERKGRWVMEQDFHGDLQVNRAWFFPVFSGVLSWSVLTLVWFERSLHSAQVSRQSWPWPLKLMTSRGVERTWISTSGYERFRGEWVKERWQRWQQERQKSKRFRLAKQLCTCIMSFVEDAENTKTTSELSFAISELWYSPLEFNSKLIANI